MAFVFVLFSSKPVQFLNWSNIWSKESTEVRSLKNRVVSSAYNVILNSSSPILNPLTLSFTKMARFSNSIPRRKRKPDRGQLCCTPWFNVRKGDAKPSLIMQLDISVYNIWTHLLKSCLKLKHLVLWQGSPNRLSRTPFWNQRKLQYQVAFLITCP